MEQQLESTDNAGASGRALLAAVKAVAVSTLATITAPVVPSTTAAASAFERMCAKQRGELSAAVVATVFGKLQTANEETVRVLRKPGLGDEVVEVTMGQSAAAGARLIVASDPVHALPGMQSRALPPKPLWTSTAA